MFPVQRPLVCGVRGSGVESEAELEADLIVGDGSVTNMSSNLGHFEPVQPAQGGVGPLESGVDGGLDPIRRCPDNVGDSIDMICHNRSPIRVVPCELPDD